MTPVEVIEYARKNAVKLVDFRFADLLGLWQHFTLSINELTEDIFANGIGFDGSSIRCFQSINESDMLLFPDPNAIFMDPFAKAETLNIICNIKDPITKQPYSRDPRYVAQKMEQYLKSTGIADTSYWGPEAEFFIFDNVRFDQTPNTAYYHVDSEAGAWNTGKEGTTEHPNLGHIPRYKEGYFPVPPMDKYNDIRGEMFLTLEKMGVTPEVHHHEVASGGQSEIDLKYTTLVAMADNVLKFKYVVKNVAQRFNKTATFMPKPIFQDNGSGMHIHQSLWKNGSNIFHQLGTYAGLSKNAQYYIGGLIKHAPAVCAFIAPTTNSYKRLVPGYEAPINLIYSQRNRSACIRIPMYSDSEKAKRIEFRSPDPSCNPYLAFSALLMAGLDGIQNKIEPPAPIDKNLYDLEPEEMADVKNLPADLSEALDALEKNHEFLLKGDVFTDDLIEKWISYKREKEVDALRLRPHPHEFAMYYDV